MERLHAGLIGLAGWRRLLAAFGFGLLSVAALPPVYAVPLLIPAFVGFFWLIQASQRLRSAFLIGYMFGFGFFLAGLYWVGIAFFVDPDRHGWMAPFGVVGMAAGLAFFPAVVAWLLRSSRRKGAGAVLLLAAIWTGAEWLRSWAFTGFPWNLLGTVWTFSDAAIQPAAFVGTYGLGLITLTAATMPALLADPGTSRRYVTTAIIVALSLPGLAWISGLARLAGDGPPDVEGVRLRLVQPNIPQRLKWSRELRIEHVLRQIEMGREAADPLPTHIIWGETMVPFFIEREPDLRAAIGKGTPEGGLTIVGAPRANPPGEQPFQVWNSMRVIDHEGRLIAGYDKNHLVPFGEYVPLRGFLPLAKLTEGTTDFSRGPGRVTLRLNGLPPVSPLICYEVIFPGRVVDAADRPRWMLNLTNDSWYGISSGPYQHFAATRMRAVEEGLPMIRVANGGISAIIDAFGREIASLGLDQAGNIDGPLPGALASPTPYGRFGDVIPLTIAAIWLLLGLATTGKERR